MKVQMCDVLSVLFLFSIEHAFSQTYTCSTGLTTDLSTSSNVDCRDYYVCDDNRITSTSGQIVCRSAYSCETASSGDYLRPCTNLYCRGTGACYRQNMYVYSTSCATSNTNNAYCESVISCAGSSSTFKSQLTNFGNFWCDGRLACRYSTISATIEDMIVYCRGSESCLYSSITAGISGSILYCESYYSCAATTISSNFDYVYCFGRYSCSSAVISVNADYVRCGGYRSCESASISGVEDTTLVECGASYACRYATISGVNETINYGYYGLHGGTISNINYINDHGHEFGFDSSVISNIGIINTYEYNNAFSNSDIFNVSEINDYGNGYNFISSTLRDVENINIYGKYSLQNSEISNDGLTVMTLNLYGEYSGFNATVNCFQDTFEDVCNINCLSNTACVNLTVNCFATCNVDCDISNGIACPAGFTGPSPNPTRMPSFNPTGAPTDIPTIEPTTAPTKTPSKNPTGMPSNTPSSRPTVTPSDDPTERTETTRTTLTTTLTTTTTTTKAAETSNVKSGEQSSITSKVDLTDCLTDHSGIFWICLMLFLLFLISLIVNVILLTRIQVVKKIVSKTAQSNNKNNNNNNNNNTGLGLNRIASLSAGQALAQPMSSLEAELGLATNAIAGNFATNSNQVPIIYAINSNGSVAARPLPLQGGLVQVQGQKQGMGRSDVELVFSDGSGANKANVDGERAVGVVGNEIGLAGGAGMRVDAYVGKSEGQKEVTKLDQGLLDAIEADDARNDKLE